MNYILAEENRAQLLPFTFTRPVGQIRIGILTIAEKWEKYLGTTISYATENYLSKKYPLTVAEENCVINSAVLPSKSLVQVITALKHDEILKQGERFIAYKSATIKNKEDLIHLKAVDFEDELLTIDQPWDIFSKNEIALQQDFELLTPRSSKSANTRY